MQILVQFFLLQIKRMIFFLLSGKINDEKNEMIYRLVFLSLPENTVVI